MKALKTLLIAALLLAFTAPAFALQATYTWPLPVDASRTGVRVERRDGVDTSPWVAQGVALGAGATSFNQQGLVIKTRYCYRAVTMGALGDGAPNLESCGTPDVPQSAGTGTLLIAP